MLCVQYFSMLLYSVIVMMTVINNRHRLCSVYCVCSVLICTHLTRHIQARLA